jgi:hypothetical protein
MVTEAPTVAPAVAFVMTAIDHCVSHGIVTKLVVPVLLQETPFEVKFSHRRSKTLVAFNKNLTYSKSSGSAEGFKSGVSLMLVVPDVALFLTKVTFVGAI